MGTTCNVGIIGYSWAATALIPAINATSQGRVTAVCSSRALDANELGTRYGVPIRVYGDLDEMLESPDVHVVDITGYPDQHASQFIRALQAGKHVILDWGLTIWLAAWYTRAAKRAAGQHVSTYPSNHAGLSLL